MNTEQTTSHPINSWTYALSLMLERTGYYGITATMIMYMNKVLLMDEVFSEHHAYEIYPFIFGFTALMKIAGGILGDLALGNKKAVILGGIFQAIGAFTLCVPNTTMFYTGIVLILIGVGLFIPNIFSLFGKEYLDKKQLLDSGFTGLHWFVTMGALLGTTVVVLISENIGFSAGFITAGVLSLVGAFVPSLCRETNLIVPDFLSSDASRSLKILGAFLLGGLFWIVFNPINQAQYGLLENAPEILSLLDKNKTYVLGSGSIIVLGIVFTILWTVYNVRPIFKIILAFGLILVSAGLIHYIPSILTASNTFVYLVVAMIFSIAELLILPTINGLVAQYSNPKYMAIVLGFLSIPYVVFQNIWNNMHRHFGSFYSHEFKVVISLGIGIFIVAVIYVLIGELNETKNSEV